MNKDSGISTNTARKLGFTSGAPLEMGAIPTTGQALALVGGVITGLDVTGSDAGLTSLAAADAGAGLAYPSAANTWTRLTIAADQGFYSTSTSAIAQYSLTSFGRSLCGYSTAPLARAGLAAQGGGWRTTSSGTDTLVGTDGVVEFTASCTITLPSAAESGVFVGKTITLIAATAGIVLTLRRAGSDTINGGATDVVVSMPTVRGTLAVTAQTVTAWGSLQPGSLTATGARGYIADGSFYMIPTAMVGGVSVDVGAAVAPTSGADPTPFSCTASGANLTVPAGAHSTGSLESAGYRQSWTLASLGITLPSGVSRVRLQMAVTSFTEGARANTQQVLVGVGTDATLHEAIGFFRNSTGALWGWANCKTTALPTNSAGASTTREVRTSTLVGTATSITTVGERYGASAAYEASADFSAAAGLAAVPNTISLWAFRKTGSSTTDWTLNALTWRVDAVPV